MGRNKQKNSLPSCALSCFLEIQAVTCVGKRRKRKKAVSNWTKKIDPEFLGQTLILLSGAIAVETKDQISSFEDPLIHIRHFCYRCRVA